MHTNITALHEKWDSINNVLSEPGFITSVYTYYINELLIVCHIPLRFCIRLRAEKSIPVGVRMIGFFQTISM